VRLQPPTSGSFLLRWTGFAQLVLPPLLILLSIGCPVSADQDAKRLYEDLLTDYNRLIRPVGNNSDRLTVKLGLKLSQLIDVVSFIHPGRPAGPIKQHMSVHYLLISHFPRI
jgi:Neurotransmitter-gated ion-channel ligand binding domain